MVDARTLERRVILVSAAFVLSLFGLVALAIEVFGVGLPTCITDVKPFQKGEVLFPAPGHYDVHFLARMWKFEPAEITIPVGSTVDIYLSTADVTHGFDILGTNVNLLAVPGVVNYERVKFDKAGDYQVICHEYCGTGHHNMSGIIHVEDPTIQRGTVPITQAEPASGHPGYKLLQDKSCLACHTVNGSPSTGPTFKGLYGSQVKLADGSTVTADDAYIRESIRQPTAKVVQGFAPIMPQLPVSDAEIDQIIAYMRTIK